MTEILIKNFSVTLTHLFIFRNNIFVHSDLLNQNKLAANVNFKIVISILRIQHNEDNLNSPSGTGLKHCFSLGTLRAGIVWFVLFVCL